MGRASVSILMQMDRSGLPPWTQMTCADKKTWAEPEMQALTGRLDPKAEQMTRCNNSRPSPYPQIVPRKHQYRRKKRTQEHSSTLLLEVKWKTQNVKRQPNLLLPQDSKIHEGGDGYDEKDDLPLGFLSPRFQSNREKNMKQVPEEGYSTNSLTSPQPVLLTTGNVRETAMDDRRHKRHGDSQHYVGSQRGSWIWERMWAEKLVLSE